MSNLTVACDTCNVAVKDVFDPGTGTRLLEVLAGDLVVTDQCFVRDEIRFLNAGRLIFAPVKQGDRPPGYFDQYFVICRKITVIGGFRGGDGLPCSPDDPGTEYKNNNVITWLDRLQSAEKGPAHGGPAGNGESFGGWVDQGQGNDGVDGGTGGSGATGNPGHPGASAPRRLTVIAVEVDVRPLGHLTIDWDGQNGGDGGRGQHGGNGGRGMNGRIGESDTTWPGTGCDRAPGNGGNAGDGGNGGHGGDGGRGGNAGEIVVISTHGNVTTGPFVTGDISYRKDGGSGGRGGGSGAGGNGGLVFGQPGFATSECGNALPGQSGQAGEPTPVPALDSDPGRGATGGSGSGAPLVLQDLQTSTCADKLPLALAFDASGLQPASYCRGFSTPNTGDGSITGQHLGQATSVSSSLAGVTPSIRLTSTDAQIDLHFQIAGNSALGLGNLTFTRAFGPNQTLPNAMTVQKFEVLSILPVSGARGNAVDVTITGHCFDPSALVQQVLVSGLGVNVINVVVVDDHTVQCVFDIGALTALGARNVTVHTGLFSHTLVDGFTIT